MIEIYPAVYSKGRQAELAAISIKSYPGQQPNTLEAINGKIYEYSLNRHTGRPVGTLHEVHMFVNQNTMNDDYRIICSNGEIIVRHEEVKFIVVKATVSRSPIYGPLIK
jgi:hypothetical protein